MPKILSAYDFNEAQELLQQNNIGFIKVGDDYVELPSYGFKSHPFLIHRYFLNNQNQDVAYYTPSIHSLFIHDAPRTWHQSFIDKLKIRFDI